MTTPERIHRAFRQLGGLPARSWSGAAMAVVDQAAVGGAVFAVTLLVGRVCGPAELGIFSLGMTLAWVVLAAQESLVTTPYTIYGNRLSGGAKRTYAGNVLLHFVVLQLVAGGCLAAMAVVFRAGVGPLGMAAVTWALVAVVPFWLLREIARRFAFADLDVRAALISSVTCAVIQILCVAAFVATGILSAVTAFVAIGLGGGVAGGIWLISRRRSLDPEPKGAAEDFRTNWKLGKWFLASQLVGMLAGIFPQWATAIALDEAAAGVLAACFLIIRVANPLFTSVNNVLTPYVAREFAREGVRAVQLAVARTTWALVAVLSVFAVTLFLVGGPLLTALFGAEFAGQRWTITALAVGQCAVVAAMPVGRGLQVFERPDINFKTQIVNVSVTVLLTLMLIRSWGVIGAAWAFAAGAVCDAILLAVAYRVVVAERIRAASQTTAKNTEGASYSVARDQILTDEAPFVEHIG